MAVRRAGPSDFESIASLRKPSKIAMTASGAGFLGQKATYISPEIAREKQLQATIPGLLSGVSMGLVAVEGKDIVGTAELVLRKTQGTVFIKNMIVQSEYRRRGHARTLLEESRKYALEEGASELRLDVLRNNEAALGLYKSFGFLEWATLTGSLLSAMKVGKVEMSLSLR